MMQNDPPKSQDVSEPDANADEATGASSLPLDYVRELRAEKGRWQVRARELEAAAVHARNELSAARAAADARVLQAEVKVLALRAGMIDPDGVKLLDLSGVQLTSAGNVVGGDDAIAAARAARPWLFANARTSNPAQPPRPHDMHDTGDARRMPAGEYALARKNRAWRR